MFIKYSWRCICSAFKDGYSSNNYIILLESKLHLSHWEIIFQHASPWPWDQNTRYLFFLKPYLMLNSHCNVMLLHYENLFIGVFQKLVTNWFGFCLLKDDTGDNTAGKKMINTRQKAGDFHSLLKDVIGLIGSHFPVCIDFIPRTRMSELFLWLDSITNFTFFILLRKFISYGPACQITFTSFFPPL